MLIRTWNLFHGNAKPPQRRAFLDEMIELATADEPDVLCVQEVPAWELDRFTVGDVAARPSLGPLPIPRELGRILTQVHHGLFRSAFGGQVAEAEVRRRELDVGTGAGESGCELVVVPRRERRGIRKQDAHAK